MPDVFGIKINKMEQRSVPPGEVKRYIELLKKHQKCVDQLIDLKSSGLMSDEEIQKKVTALIIEMHENVDKVLKDSQIIGDQESDSEWKDKIE